MIGMHAHVTDDMDRHDGQHPQRDRNRKSGTFEALGVVGHVMAEREGDQREWG